MTVRSRAAALAVLGLVASAVLGVAGCGASGPAARPPLPTPPRTAFSPAASSPAPASSGARSSSDPTGLLATPTPSPPSTPARSRVATPAPSPTPAPTSAARGPLIVIDPGHSGRSIRSTDRASGLRDIDYPNYPEIYEMFDIGSCVGEGLRADGYRVVLTKHRALDSVGLAERARIADRSRAALAVSVHDDHSQGPDFQATYSQRGIQHGGAYHPMYRGSGSSRTVFTDARVARASERAAVIMARERTRAQGRRVGVRENTYSGRPPLEPGNLALVQLLAKVPWVYNEAGARSGGSTTRAMSIATEEAYAKGLLVGVEAAVPLSSGVVAQPSAGVRGLRRCLLVAASPGGGRATRPARYRPPS